MVLRGNRPLTTDTRQATTEGSTRRDLVECFLALVLSSITIATMWFVYDLTKDLVSQGANTELILLCIIILVGGRDAALKLLDRMGVSIVNKGDGKEGNGVEVLKRVMTKPFFF